MRKICFLILFFNCQVLTSYSAKRRNAWYNYDLGTERLSYKPWNDHGNTGRKSRNYANAESQAEQDGENPYNLNDPIITLTTVINVTVTVTADESLIVATPPIQILSSTVEAIESQWTIPANQVPSSIGSAAASVNQASPSAGTVVPSSAEQTPTTASLTSAATASVSAPNSQSVTATDGATATPAAQINPSVTATAATVAPTITVLPGTTV